MTNTEKTYKFDGSIGVTLTTNASSIEDAHKKFQKGGITSFEFYYQSLDDNAEQENIEEIA